MEHLQISTQAKLLSPNIFNWNGNLFNGLLQTRYAVGLQSEAEGYNNTMLTLGNKLNFSKFQVFFDYMRADEQLDRLKYTPAGKNNSLLKDVTYNTFVLKGEYQPIPKLNIFAQGIYETAENNELNNKMIGLGYFTGVEYIPNITNNTNRVSIGMMYRIKAF